MNRRGSSHLGRRAAALLLAAVLCAAFPTPGKAAVDAPYNGYQYGIDGAASPGPVGYVCSRSVKSSFTAASSFGKPADMFISADNRLYILSSEDASIAVLDENLQYLETIRLTLDGEEKAFAGAAGLFVSGTGEKVTLLVTSPDEGVVYVCDGGGRIRSSIGRPDTDLLDDSFLFQPSKVLMDADGSVYVLSPGMYIGAARFSAGGEFQGFFGTNKVQVTPKVLFDSFWKKLLNDEQGSKLARYVPVEYANFDVDSEKFVYTVTEKSNSNQEATGQIKRINAKGINILPDQKYGDREVTWDAARLIDSTFVDVAVMEGFGVAALDSQRGRVFLYDMDGNWIQSFGGLGMYEGTFSKPVAIDTIGEKIYVLDQMTESVLLFEPTGYGRKIIEGFRLYNEGLYERSIGVWQEVAAMNAAFYPAYVGIGKGYMAQKQYDQAMHYFRLGYDTAGYSAAHAKRRQADLTRYFPWIFLAAAVLVGWLILSDRKKGTRRKKFVNPYRLTAPRQIRYALFHPTEGFEAVAGSMRLKTMLLVCGGTAAAWFLASVVNWQFTGFAFQDVTASETFNLFIHLGKTVVLLLLWSLANWFVCTMTDGSGKFIDILTVSSISLLPYIASLLLSTVLSNVLTASEGAFLTTLQVILILWSALLMFSGLKAIHEFTLGKTVATVLFTLVAIALMLIIALLLWSLYQQLIVFLSSVSKEISFMLR